MTDCEEYQRPVGPNLWRARCASSLMHLQRHCQEIIPHWIIRLRNKATDCKNLCLLLQCWLMQS